MPSLRFLALVLSFIALPAASQSAQAPQAPAPTLAAALATVQPVTWCLEEAALDGLLEQARKTQGAAWDLLEAPAASVPPFALVARLLKRVGDKQWAPVPGPAPKPLKCWSVAQEYLIAGQHGSNLGKLARVNQSLGGGGDVLLFRDGQGNGWQFVFDLSTIYKPLPDLLKGQGDMKAAMQTLNARASLPDSAEAALQDLLKGRWVQAAEPARRKEIRSLCPDLPLIHELDILGELLQTKPDPQRLSQAATSLRRLMPFHPKIQNLCGLAFLAAADPAQAVAQKGWCGRF